VFFYTPIEISTSNVNKNQILRIGGLVKPGSVITKEKKYTVITSFIITDCSHDIKVIFDQALPNLFREKQGVVALGKFNKDNLFIASELLTKHSEVYTPPTSTKDNNQETYCKK
jgi:cytochrome c-type biogenesis protein CcmE